MADKLKKSWTKKPCPGCKQPPQFRRPADGVCKDCERKLAFAEESMKTEKRRKDLVLVSLPRAYHALPHFSDGTHCAGVSFDLNEEPLDVLKLAVMEVVSMAGREVTFSQAVEFLGKKKDPNDAPGVCQRIPKRELAKARDTRSAEALVWSDGSSCSRTYWLAPRGLAEQLEVMYRTAYEISVLRYREGYSNGSSLLVGLASGDKSIEQFNNATVGKSE